jgi:dTDP-4-dehydrorhamnose reductase
MTILITGGTGILGKELKKIFPNSVTPTHTELDITKENSINEFFEKNKIETVIHTAAITKIRACEENHQNAWNTNLEGTKNLINSIQKFNKNIKFIYISTACVFDGKHGMYNEESIPYPKNFYALTKLLGEQEVRKIENYLIIRTNFVGKSKWPYSNAFTDRYGTYLFANTVAKALKEILKDEQTGIIHIVGNKKMSMFDLAKITTPNIKPMTIKDYSGPKLTMDMSLDSKNWKKYDINE